ncbi:ferredoxin [Nocardia brasiliensis]|uniref:ferredoxin n=1 Tax=Nocardia brasiliensis TaxID=37326 RepID=UPI001E2D46AB|nr:ferredoxin [Nocardia brasiliensis]
MSDIPRRWDPMTSVPPDLDYLAYHGEKWADRHGMNVPGPFYTGQTDNCWTGRVHAPRHVLYGGQYYSEFVYRQPKSPSEVEALLRAAWDDPYGGYACDGDSQWTPAAVRAWWSSRGKVEEHLTELLAEFTKEGAHPDDADVAAGIRDFRTYLATDLENDLRAYVFRLEQGRYPAADDPLPLL